jgi:hypothetical protein
MPQASFPVSMLLCLRLTRDGRSRERIPARRATRNRWSRPRTGHPGRKGRPSQAHASFETRGPDAPQAGIRGACDHRGSRPQDCDCPRRNPSRAPRCQQRLMVAHAKRREQLAAGECSRVAAPRPAPVAAQAGEEERKSELLDAELRAEAAVPKTGSATRERALGRGGLSTRSAARRL